MERGTLAMDKDIFTSRGEQSLSKKENKLICVFSTKLVPLKRCCDTLNINTNTNVLQIAQFCRFETLVSRGLECHFKLLLCSCSATVPAVPQWCSTVQSSAGRPQCGLPVCTTTATSTAANFGFFPESAPEICITRWCGPATLKQTSCKTPPYPNIALARYPTCHPDLG